MTPIESPPREPAPRKRPYHAPRLITYGSVQRLTTVKRGSNNDGGMKPRTRLSGTMT